VGYFRRRISRQRCASQVARAVARQSRAGLVGWIEAPAEPPRATRRTTYLRFAVGHIHEDSHQQLGVFQAAYQLRNGGGCGSDAGAMLNPLLRWFGENLHAPEVTCRAIFWFKSDAAPCIGRIWEMIHVLTSHDHGVWMMRSDAPGRIVYEDDFQVAAVPYRDRRWRRRRV
jgi:hypothetical protein